MNNEEAYKHIENVVFNYEEKELSSLKDRKLNNDALNHIREALKNERPQSAWIPVSERLPDNETEVLFQYQYGKSMMVGYYVHDFTEYPPEFADENETGWYDNKDNFICGSDEVIAWQPLPEPYKKGGAE